MLKQYLGSLTKYDMLEPNEMVSIFILNKKQLKAAIANGTQEPNGAITTMGQINNEITIKVL